MKTATYLAILCLTIIACPCCSKETKGLTEEIRIMKEENNFLKAENIALKKELEELYKKIDEKDGARPKEQVKEVEANPGKDASKKAEKAESEKLKKPTNEKPSGSHH
ncbi:MAG TPA: hypothetical protein VMT62_03635 [Syntrophorhabdaceae bacterium]|nr:hypothetical protein [Syntrophorhabdaceae bacterium]